MFALGKPQKKSSSTNGQAIKALPPPSSLMAIGTKNNKIIFIFEWQQIKKQSFKKSSFFLNGLAFTLPPPLLMVWPLVEELFFAA